MADLTEEDRRALEWQRDRVRQKEAKIRAEARLQGDPVARRELAENWAPKVAAIREGSNCGDS